MYFLPLYFPPSPLSVYDDFIPFLLERMYCHVKLVPSVKRDLRPVVSMPREVDPSLK